MVHKQLSGHHIRAFWLFCFLWPSAALCVRLFQMAYSSSSPLSPEQQINMLGRASGSLSRDDLKALDVGCEVTKEVLLRRVQDLVRDARGGSILTSKSCDGTPINVALWTSHTLRPGKKIKTKGREGVEFLVSNQFVRAFMPAGDTRTAVVMAEAVPLHKTKRAAAILAAAHKGWVDLRALGHKGPLIDHFVWDRAGLTRLEHDSRLWHAARPRYEPPADLDPDTFAKLNFFVVTPCSLHDSQNAFRWGKLNQFQDKSLMRDLYISVESLRNSADLISTRICSWISRMLSYAPPRGEDWTNKRRELLDALGVDMDTVSIITDDLQLCWEDGRLGIWDGTKACSERKSWSFT